MLDEHDGRRTVYVRHCDPSGTGEGLGSHARGTLYPLLRIAVHFDWDILWETPPGLGVANHRSEYVHELQDLGQWFGFCTNDSIKKDAVGIPIDLENDVRLGRILGYAGILISSIETYVEENGSGSFYGGNNKEGIFLVTLNGRFEYQDDPTWPVIKFMQARCLFWEQEDKKNKREMCEEEAEFSNKTLRVAIHIRVPEDYCEDSWKQANSISHPICTIEAIHSHFQSIVDSNQRPFLVIDVYTEESFSSDSEQKLRFSIAALSFVANINIYRQTPLLSTIRGMSTADILVPASSFLSAMASYFCNTLIVLPDEETRRTKYFAPHLKHGSCPIVEVQNEEGVSRALEKLWKQER